MCDVLCADLAVVRFAPPGTRFGSGEEAGAADDASRNSDARLVRTTRRWYSTVLQEDGPAILEVLRCADFPSTLVRAARALRASLIVVAHTRNGAFARRIVHETGVPLFVARPPRASYAIVAATDLSDRRYPALREALRIARGYVAPAVFVHNVAKDRESRSTPRSASRGRDEDRRANSAGRHDRGHWQFDRAGRVLRVRCPQVVLSRPDTAEAILDFAQRLDADLVVLGTHLRRQRDDRHRHVSVATSVVERATISVLLIPLCSQRARERTDNVFVDPVERAHREGDG